MERTPEPGWFSGEPEDDECIDLNGWPPASFSQHKEWVTPTHRTSYAGTRRTDEIDEAVDGYNGDLLHGEDVMTREEYISVLKSKGVL